jgi:site-specific recombinase XerD
MGHGMKHSEQIVTFIETSINGAKPKDGKRSEYRLKSTRGNVMEHLVLEVLPAAGRATKPRRVWRVHYDHRENGQRLRRKIKIGDTNSALSEINARWLEIKAALDTGRDWLAEQQKLRQVDEIATRKVYTFADLASDYLEKHAKTNKRTWRDDRSKLNAHILPSIGQIAAKEVTKRDIIEIVDRIAIEREAPVQADRTTALISSIYNWGRDEDLVQHNPADRIRKRSSRKRRTRLLSHDELRTLWRWCEQPGSMTQHRCRLVIRLAILLGQRRNQIASAKKAELIGLGTGRAAFHIPHARNKNKDDLHVVPLPPEAEKLFQEALAHAGKGEFVFPSEVKSEVALHADTVTDEIAIARKNLGIAPSQDGEEAVLHGLRHLVKTEMKSLGIPAEVRKRIQSHRSKTATSDMDEWYDHAEYYDEDFKALAAWEGRLLNIVSADSELDGGPEA